MTDVHTEHCCKHHCKYAYTDDDDKKCTVVSGELKQSFPCETMEWICEGNNLEGVAMKIASHYIKLLGRANTKAKIEMGYHHGNPHADDVDLFVKLLKRRNERGDDY